MYGNRISAWREHFFVKAMETIDAIANGAQEIGHGREYRRD